MHMRNTTLIVIVGVFAACAAPQKQTWSNTFKGDGEDAFLVDADFTCVGNKPFAQVGDDFIANVKGHGDDAAALLSSKKAGTYPVGTVLSLMPGEAMVKRGAGFSADTNDWEFLTLDLSTGSAIITARGTTDVKNLGGTCISCYAPAKDHDLVCGGGGACKPLPFFISTHIVPSSDDPRCKEK